MKCHIRAGLELAWVPRVLNFWTVMSGTRWFWQFYYILLFCTLEFWGFTGDWHPLFQIPNSSPAQPLLLAPSKLFTFRHPWLCKLYLNGRIHLLFQWNIDGCLPELCSYLHIYDLPSWKTPILTSKIGSLRCSRSCLSTWVARFI